ncbi:MAG: response regulator [Magnetococcales bacterium]|nr:response regulator [Magnetococcales bacterium]
MMKQGNQKVQDDGHVIPSPLAILLVEDAEENRMVLEAFLKPLNCRVKTAENGAEAVAMFMKERFSVVLMDIEMPVMDGIAATMNIRAWEKQNQVDAPTPIFALTGHSSGEELRRCLESGCNHYLTKPVRRQQLLDTVRPFLGGE